MLQCKRAPRGINLAILPFIGILGGTALFANRESLFVLGMPFTLFWIVLWIVLASLVMFTISNLGAHSLNR
ncbi:DUF3311 domain-containing protein [Brevibacillus ginsengisoli]|uniref:DUF3311 domain-containing protein n=1 Tax=Brevibacillus ginsengisoli TaxID=363854 RepID=UPI003CE7CF32